MITPDHREQDAACAQGGSVVAPQRSGYRALAHDTPTGAVT
jgi:hypothetical protein